MESIMKGDKRNKCFICGREGRTELHHIYKGKNRKISDQNGFVVHLCPKCHRGTDGVHGKFGHLKDMYLEKACQLAYEESHSRAEFMKLIGRNYIEEDED